MKRLKLTDESFRAYKVGGVFLPDPIAGKVLGGGGGSNSTATAIDSLPVPLPSKPITSANPEVVQAESDFARANLLKKSIKKTIQAGDTGGFNPGLPNPAGGKSFPSSYKPKF